MMFLSVIIPAHNEEKRVAETLHTISTALFPIKPSYEIIVVTNGCSDSTAAIARDYKNLIDDAVKVFDFSERGKGLAVRYGMLMAKGKYRYMCDMDLSTPITEISSFIQAADPHTDIVIGSREIDRSSVSTTVRRRIIGRVFNLLANQLVPGIQDTQCGFKMFKDHAAAHIFANARINGMAFDVEALYLARKFGYKVKELSIPWVHNPDSRVRLVADSSQMAMDLLRIWLKNRSHLPQVNKNFPYSEQLR